VYEQAIGRAFEHVAVSSRLKVDTVAIAKRPDPDGGDGLRHIGLGKAHAGEPVRLLIADDHIRVVREDGSLLRELVLDVSRDYQPQLDSSSMS
jgi:hypothetical protein